VFEYCVWVDGGWQWQLHDEVGVGGVGVEFVDCLFDVCLCCVGG